MTKAVTASVSQGQSADARGAKQAGSAWASMNGHRLDPPDPIDQAIADTPQAIPAKRYDFAVSETGGKPKPASVTFPADLTWEELVAMLEGVNKMGQQVVMEAPKTGLTLVRAPLPKQ